MGEWIDRIDLVTGVAVALLVHALLGAAAWFSSESGRDYLKQFFKVSLKIAPAYTVVAFVAAWLVFGRAEPNIKHIPFHNTGSEFQTIAGSNGATFCALGQVSWRYSIPHMEQDQQTQGYLYRNCQIKHDGIEWKGRSGGSKDEDGCTAICLFTDGSQ